MGLDHGGAYLMSFFSFGSIFHKWNDPPSFDPFQKIIA